ncbi:MAG TPA: 6,7-dimethyl-8-ribityllumazine synthase [Gemmatimonadales bacterium]|nr:6,7-dimethyl-8-ribityllumazine synthase [Gemmatimonadales bacterium]
MPEYRGRLRAEGKRFAIVVAQFNELITSRLLMGAQSAFWQHGVPEEAIDIAYVPGAFELPLVAKTLAHSGRYAAVVCLGAVIRGETAHFEHVAAQAAAGIAAASRETGVPVLFGVLTTDTIEQAIERAGTKAGNKGFDAAADAIRMADLMEQLPRA